MPKPTRETFNCPNCDAEVPVGAAACPECGSDEETGWSEDTIYDDLDLPEGYGPEEEPARFNEKTWKVVTIIVLISLAILMVMRIL